MRALSVRGVLGLLPLLGVACSAGGNDAKSGGQPHGQSGSAGAAVGSSGGASSGGQGSSAGSPVQGGGNGAEAGASAGSAGKAGSAGSSGSGMPCDGASIFCSDFEAAAIAPELVFFPEYLRATQSFVTLDAMVSHGGKQALKVAGTDYSQMLAVTVPSKFWGRVYLRSDTDIQEGHNTYLAAGTGTGDPNEGTYIRIGEHQCQLELNRNTDDKELLSNGGTYMCQGGVKLLKDTWYCLEFYFDGPAQETRVFVDGDEVTALHTTDWGVYDYKILKLGYEKYHGGPKNLWYDDLALGPDQLGCP